MISSLKPATRYTVTVVIPETDSRFEGDGLIDLEEGLDKMLQSFGTVERTGFSRVKGGRSVRVTLATYAIPGDIKRAAEDFAQANATVRRLG